MIYLNERENRVWFEGEPWTIAQEAAYLIAKACEVANEDKEIDVDGAKLWDEARAYMNARSYKAVIEDTEKWFRECAEAEREETK